MAHDKLDSDVINKNFTRKKNKKPARDIQEKSNSKWIVFSQYNVSFILSPCMVQFACVGKYLNMSEMRIFEIIMSMLNKFHPK